MMKAVRVYLVSALLLQFYIPVVDASKLDIQIEEAKLKMQARQDKVLSLKNSLSELTSLKVKPFVPQQSHEKNNIHALPCKKGFFGWGIKNANTEYKDCSYKYSPTKKADIDRLAESIRVHIMEGWEIDRSEMYKQDILNPDEITNIDRYRYKKILRK